MKKSLLRSLITALVCMFAVTLVGCAKTTSDEIFRFEVSTLNLTVNKEMNIGLIPGSVKGEEKVEYVAEIQKEVEENDKIITTWVDASEYLEVVGSEKSEEGKAISKVSDKVVFKAKKDGIVRVTATVISDKTISNFITVTIEKERLSNMTLSVDNKSLIVGDTGQATLKTNPESITNDAIWKTSDSKVVTIDENGVYTAVGKGKCEIIAISKHDEKMIAKVEVDVQAIIYTIVYLDAKGNEFKKQEVEAGSVITVVSGKPTAPTGHEFKGWKIGDEDFVSGGIAVGDMEVTPVFSPKTYKIKLSIGTTTYQEVSCVYGEVTQMPEGYTDPVQDGKVFVGWFYNADTEKEQFVFGNVLESTKTTYKAVFEDAPSE